jgi:hypothetical protein
MSGICHLSVEEASAYEQFGIRPSHRNHYHTDTLTALELIRMDLARDVTGLPAIVDQDSNNRTWKGQMSGGYQVRQFVRVVDEGKTRRARKDSSEHQQQIESARRC